MSDFKLSHDTEKKLSHICAQLAITDNYDKRMVPNLCRDYLYFYDKYVRTQYLAPIVAALECHIQRDHDMQGFKIIINEEKREKSKARMGIAFLRRDKRRYEITIPAGLDAIDARNMVAHELGHLFYVMNYLHGGDVSGSDADNVMIDKMADVFGIFTIMERTDFYKDKAAGVCRDRWEDIVYDFMKMGRGRRSLTNPDESTVRR